jgi:SAM-dependent methyltransferase
MCAMAFVKTIAQYFRFFYYTASNWNIVLAFFMLYHDIRGAVKYGIRRSFAPVPLYKLTTGNADISKSSPYEAVSFYMLEKLLNEFRTFTQNTSIIDLGCGKGRVLTVAAYFGFNKIAGIDFAKELCDEAERNMQIVQQRIPHISYKIIRANVLDYDIEAEDSVFFLFNPFGIDTLVRFMTKLEKSSERYPRDIWFIYASPQHESVLIERGYKAVYNEKILNLKGSIFFKAH